MIEKCGRCGLETNNKCHEVNPIDENGRNLKRIILCFNCHDSWQNFYQKHVKRNSIEYKMHFERLWARNWQRFLKTVDKEVVEFT